MRLVDLGGDDLRKGKGVAVCDSKVSALLVSNVLNEEVESSRTIRELKSASEQVSFLTAVAQYQPIQREACALIVIGVF
jgi:hypothetical protein